MPARITIGDPSKAIVATVIVKRFAFFIFVSTCFSMFNFTARHGTNSCRAFRARHQLDAALPTELPGSELATGLSRQNRFCFHRKLFGHSSS
jgi:hypothetical protein